MLFSLELKIERIFLRVIIFSRIVIIFRIFNMLRIRIEEEEEVEDYIESQTHLSTLWEDRSQSHGL